MATASRSSASAPVSGAPEKRSGGSALLLDITGRRTSSTLVDRVDGGRHRFVVSASRLRPSGEQDDIVTRLRDVIELIEARSARRLLESNRLIAPERKDGSGCDAAVLTLSLPLNVAIVGATSSALRSRLDTILETCVVSRVPGLDPKATRQSDRSLFGECIELLDRHPDLLIVMPEPDAKRGKVETSIGQYLAAALEHTFGEHPIVLGLGAKALTDPLSGLLSRFADFRSADLDSANGPEGLRQELLAIWRDTLDRRYAGYGYIQSWLRVPPVSTADGFAVALRYLASKRQSNVWGVDLGPRATAIVRATPNQSSFSVSGHGSANATQWLWNQGTDDPATATGADERRRDLLWNQLARPAAHQVTSDELGATWHVAREAIASTLRLSPLPGPTPKGGTELLVLRGDVAQSVAHSADAVAGLASEIRRSGILEIAIDRHGIIPGLGALASAEPLISVETLLADGLDSLGTVVIGRSRIDSPGICATVELRSKSGVQKCEVSTDAPKALQLPADESADLTITPAKSSDFGRGAGKSISLRVVGGTLGVVLAANIESKPAARASRGK